MDQLDSSKRGTVTALDRVQRALFYASIAGGVGGVVGAVGAVVSRGRLGVLASTLATFSGYSIFGIGYFGCRETLMAVNPDRPRMNSAVSGSIFGGIVALPLGPVRSLQSAALYSLVCLAGQLGVEEFDAMQLRRAATRVLEEEMERHEAAGEDGSKPRGELKTVLRGEEAAVERQRLAEEFQRKREAVGDGIVARLLQGRPGDLGSWESMSALPDWVPLKLESPAQAEQRLVRRLEAVEQSLHRDDTARRMAATGEGVGKRVGVER